jgi:hypothetical protein
MPDPAHWRHELHQDPDGTYRLEILDERGERVPIARQITQAQAELLLRAIDQEARRRLYAVAEIIRDPEFMATTVIAIKRDNGRRGG